MGQSAAQESKGKEMKRSYMVERLAFYILESSGHNDATEFAEGILDWLEEQGMQPPAYNKFVEAQGVASPSPDLKLYYKLPCNEWEPE